MAMSAIIIIVFLALFGMVYGQQHSAQHHNSIHHDRVSRATASPHQYTFYNGGFKPINATYFASQYNPLGTNFTGGATLTLGSGGGMEVSIAINAPYMGSPSWNTHGHDQNKSLEYTAHVYAQPCTVNDGGGHFAFDASWSISSTQDQEISPTVVCTHEGVCTGRDDNDRDWKPIYGLNSGLSVVIHNTESSPTNAYTKLLCADLLPTRIYSGATSTLASYSQPTNYMFTTGTASMHVGVTQMHTFININGGVETYSKTFKTHLHASPCGVSEGGAHYVNPHTPEAAGTAGGENWPELVCDGGGLCSGRATSVWVPTETAVATGLSIVVHDTPSAGGGGGSGVKMLCVDFTRSKMYSATLHKLASYTGSSSYADSTGSAVAMVGTKSLTTKVVLAADSLSPLENQQFAAHLHARPCANDGGGHYKHDVDGSVDAENENWPRVMCDANGGCGGAASNAWAPRTFVTELSIVVHDTPVDGSKMLCGDLVSPQTYTGRFTTLSSYNQSLGYGDVWGTAGLHIDAHSITTLLHMSGSDAAALRGKTFYAHLHAAPCAAGGGGHYQDPENMGVVDAVSENWPTLVCDNDGVCAGGAYNHWMPTSSALAAGLSVVVHDTPNSRVGSGKKMWCADLEPPTMYTAASFLTLPSYSGGAVYANASGTAELLVSETGIETTVQLSGALVTDPTTFKTHLHAAPCAEDGGGHYQNPKSPGVVDAIGENWPAVVCDGSGVCGGSASNTWVPRTSALTAGLSVVVHDTPGDGSKMLCADLVPPHVFSGTFATLPSYTAGANYSTSTQGTAELRVGTSWIRTRVRVSGATSQGKTFSAHLHAAPCSEDGGGHYQNPASPGVVDAIGENWPAVVCDDSGVCGGVASNDWVPTEAALISGLSIVIHDTPGTGSKMMCADLLPPKVYSGSFTRLSSYGGATDYSTSLVGTAELLVGVTGIMTRVKVSATESIGLTFAAHLHAAPCSADGGGHYQNPMNGGVANSIDENWPELMCDSGGVCTGGASNTWIPPTSALVSGLSIVIHDSPSDGSKMMCADLEPDAVYRGVFSPLAGFNSSTPYLVTGGDAILHVNVLGVISTVRLQGTALSGLTFATHLHANPCGTNSGGGHYQNPDNEGVVDAINENWPQLSCDSNGLCGGRASNLWSPEAADLATGLSIVIHDTPNGMGASGTKMLCADLIEVVLTTPVVTMVTTATQLVTMSVDVEVLSSASDNDSGVIIGAAVGGVVGVILVVLLIIIIFRKRGRRDTPAIKSGGKKHARLHQKPGGSHEAFEVQNQLYNTTNPQSAPSFNEMISKPPQTLSQPPQPSTLEYMQVESTQPVPVPLIRNNTDTVTSISTVLSTDTAGYQIPNQMQVGADNYDLNEDADDETLTAIYEFVSSEAGEISFNVGDRVRVLERADNGWWKGEINDSVGWFPGSYLDEESGSNYSAVDGLEVDEDAEYDVATTAKGLAYAELQHLENAPLPPLDNATLYRAIYDYVTAADGELNLVEGDFVTVIEKRDDGWWIGCCNGQEGWFPQTYVELAHEYDVPVRLETVAETNIDSLPFPQPQVNVNEEDEDEVPPHPSGEDDNLIEKIQGSSTEQTNLIDNFNFLSKGQNGRPLSMSLSAADSRNSFRASYNFEANAPTELSFRAGSIIEVVPGSATDGWLKGSVDGDSGWFPEAYVEPVKQTDEQSTPLLSSTNTDEDGAASTQKSRARPPPNRSAPKLASVPDDQQLSDEVESTATVERKDSAAALVNALSHTLAARTALKPPSSPSATKPPVSLVDLKPKSPPSVSVEYKPVVVSVTAAKKPALIPTASKPPLVLAATKPVAVPPTTKKPVVVPTTKPALVPTTTKPALVSTTTKPALVPTTTMPALVPATTKPALIPATTKPALVPSGKKPPISTNAKPKLAQKPVIAAVKPKFTAKPDSLAAPKPALKPTVEQPVAQQRELDVAAKPAAKPRTTTTPRALAPAPLPPTSGGATPKPAVTPAPRPRSVVSEAVVSASKVAKLPSAGETKPKPKPPMQPKARAAAVPLQQPKPTPKPTPTPSPTPQPVPRAAATPRVTKPPPPTTATSATSKAKPATGKGPKPPRPSSNAPRPSRAVPMPSRKAPPPRVVGGARAPVSKIARGSPKQPPSQLQPTARKNPSAPLPRAPSGAPPRPSSTPRVAAVSKPANVGRSKVYADVAAKTSLKTGRAVSAHTSTTPGQLSFGSGDIIVQLATADDSGMAKGMLQSGKVGLFPIAMLG